MKLLGTLFLAWTAAAFPVASIRGRSSSLQMGIFGGPTIPKIPTKAGNQQQAIDGIKAAISSPRNPSFPLLECEFPPLQALNKLGDGSLRSAIEVEKANLSFCNKLINSIAPLPFLGPKTCLMVSSSSSASSISKAKSIVKGTTVYPLAEGIPDVDQGDVCVFVSPSSQNDYMVANKLASQGITTVIVNAFAKDRKSVSEKATMAYFQKPLTYNSAVVGYLLRQYPGKWATIDATSKEVLKTFTDDEILVQGTNTPDLRESGRLVQKSVDERAIRARRG
mmetsp:Transcript_26738/g.37692  ORF Transcript_26738/g.37692 Transcript_26738/m.37692 type:complete len:279 (+) Transcript_26738:140-976(+)